MKDRTHFLDLKVPVFVNKKNGQLSISLPKKQMKDIKLFRGEIPKQINIRLKLDKQINLSLGADKK